MPRSVGRSSVYVEKLVGLAVGRDGFMKACLKPRQPGVSVYERFFGDRDNKAILRLIGGSRPRGLSNVRTSQGFSPRAPQFLRYSFSSQDFTCNVAADVGEPKVAAAVTVGQPFVIQAHEVQDRGM
jgi:hypothetical protein